MLSQRRYDYDFTMCALGIRITIASYWELWSTRREGKAVLILFYNLHSLDSMTVF